jgi:hypothetical protein
MHSGGLAQEELIATNFLLFFGPYYYERLKQIRRRREFKRHFR